MNQGQANSTTWLARAAVEAALIVFAVVLGFAVNEWRADVRADREARAALDRIAQEMAGNAAILETVIPYHEGVIERVGAEIARIESGESPARGVLLDLMPGLLPRGLQEPRLSRVAWDYAEQRGQMDPLGFELVSDLASVYSTQDSGVESTWRVIAEQFFAQVESVSETDLRPRLLLMQFAFHELAAQERFLLDMQRQVLPDVADAIGAEAGDGSGG